MTERHSKPKKYIVLLGDGMADYPLAELEDRTPLEAADIPGMDYLAQHGETGMAQTIPEGMPPGSDVANLSLMGYNPRDCYTGRSPLEAVSMGIELNKGDVTYRCNLVTLENAETIDEAVILDHSSGDITTEESTQLVQALLEEMDWKGAELYAGVSYRHCLVMRNSDTGAILTPPHDIAGQGVRGRLPGGTHGEQLKKWMQESHAILDKHPINESRRSRGLNPANCCWFWGEGTRPKLDLFNEKFGVTGGVVSAVDLLKGIGISAGMEAPDVEGATGTLHTNYAGKLAAALDILSRNDFVYIHLEGPDECGHQGNTAEKIEAIERIDAQMLKPLMEALDARGWDYHILLAPDHATPIAVRTHTTDPVPYVIYKSDAEAKPHAEGYNEKSAKATGTFVPAGHLLMGKLLD